MVREANPVQGRRQCRRKCCLGQSWRARTASQILERQVP